MDKQEKQIITTNMLLAKEKAEEAEFIQAIQRKEELIKRIEDGTISEEEAEEIEKLISYFEQKAEEKFKQSRQLKLYNIQRKARLN
jgi:hypothetical protein